MRKLERLRIGAITTIFRNDAQPELGFRLEITSFIGDHPVNRCYLTKDNELCIFKSRAEAADYAIDKLACDHVIISNLPLQDSCFNHKIQARIIQGAFSNTPPLICNIRTD
jgi:hypothetical protein